MTNIEITGDVRPMVRSLKKTAKQVRALQVRHLAFAQSFAAMAMAPFAGRSRKKQRNRNTSCVDCGAEIPPGRAGRTCVHCRPAALAEGR